MSLLSGLARILGRTLPVSRNRVVHYSVTGNSMAPTLRDGQQVLAIGTPLAGGPLPRGALVVFRHPVLPEDVNIKRIVGLPGEDIRIEDDGQVFLDDELLPEPYLAAINDGNQTDPVRRATAHRWITEEGEYFVMGDARYDSRDSRSFGVVHHNLILGRVWLRCWPPQAWGLLGRR